MPRNSARILAAAQNPGKLLMALAPITLAAAAHGADGKPDGRPTFTMNAYNGGLMYLGGWFSPVIVDLAGVKPMGKTLPALRQHEMEKIVGHVTRVEVTAGGIQAEGVISGTGDDAEEVVASSKNGFPWQASIGADPVRVEYLEAGKKATVNGNEVTGPANIVRECILFEISFVPVGADMTTSASVAAQLSKENSMEFEAWLKAKGFDKATLSASQLAALKAMFEAKAPDAEIDTLKASWGPKAEPEKNDPPAKPAPVTAAPDNADTIIAENRKRFAAESKRMAAIQAACAGKHAEIEAKAIEEGWTVEKTELEVLRAERPTAPNAIVHGGTSQPNAEVLTAAVCMGGRLAGVEKAFSEQTLEAANKNFRRGIGLQELIISAAVANGYSGNLFSAARGDLKNLLAHAMQRVPVNAAFSTLSLPGILSNVANKFLLAAFMAVEQTWRQIAAIRSVNDFKTATSYRLTGNFQYDKVGPNGQLKHGTVGEESFTNKADTYGKIFGISRQDIINDDLGALTAIPTLIGRGAALKLNDVFWAEWTTASDIATFFSTANKNYFSGATTTLGIDSLTTAEKMFYEQTDADGNPLGIMPKILLVPPALNALATQLTRSLEIRDTTASTKYPTNNPHAGKFTPVMSSYLSNANYGNSSVAWYLHADPRDLAAIEVAFLNGQETPTVESAEADFNTLGIEMRGYHDFGVNKQETRAVVKSKGAA